MTVDQVVELGKAIKVEEITFLNILSEILLKMAIIAIVVAVLCALGVLCGKYNIQRHRAIHDIQTTR